ncbi:hypothetical protein [Vibrio tubiashii]|uniref:hypothetical protein n=1 Tax=Vibrio tubiashii TaxID=29498 RepID=UPI00349EBF48
MNKSLFALAFLSVSSLSMSADLKTTETVGEFGSEGCPTATYYTDVCYALVGEELIAYNAKGSLVFPMSISDNNSSDKARSKPKPTLPVPVQPGLPNDPELPPREEIIVGIVKGYVKLNNGDVGGVPLEHELDLKPLLSKKDKEAYEQLADLGWDVTRVQEFHDIMEKQGEYADPNVDRNAALKELMQGLQKDISSMSSGDKIKAFGALNNISVNNKYGGYDSVLDQLVNGWGLGTKEQKTKFNTFNDMSGKQKANAIKNSDYAKKRDKSLDGKRVSKQTRERIKREYLKRNG